jgi:uncharacterized protein YndB with AHSA1/START domain
MATTAPPTGKVLYKSATYPHSPEVVWAALTDGEALAQWLMPNNFEPVAGRRFQFRIDPMMGFPGVIDCEVLEIDPPRRMVWSWATKPRAGKTAHPALRIEWQLTPKGEGTLLELRQWGSEALPWFWRFSMSMGWGTMLKRWLPKVLGAFERTPGGFSYRRLERAPNRGHHKTRTVPAEFHR